MDVWGKGTEVGEGKKGRGGGGCGEKLVESIINETLLFRGLS